jgi:AcrR family transcriptional regulator
MKQNPEDRRVRKTRRLLQDALVALISEKGFASVTIQDILDHANVGRSTFYMHYDNKNELLHSCFEDFCNLLEKHEMELSDFGKQSKLLGDTEYVLNFLKFVEKNHRLLKALLGKESMPMFHQYIHDYVYSYIDGFLKTAVPKSKQNSAGMKMLTQFFASGLIGAVIWWIEEDMPCPVEETDRFIRQLWAKSLSASSAL